MSSDVAGEIDLGEYAIIAENICKRFPGSPSYSFLDNLLGINFRSPNDFQGLQDISFKIKKGESVGILGENGSGKSTLLQVIAKILQPSSGTIQTNGKLAALLELGSGFNPDFTGIENVYLNASILGLSKSRIDQILDEVLDFADIDHFVNRPVKTYSSGMRMRLAFAVQVFVEPEILIIDEALGVGDQNFRLKCFNKISELLSKEITFILVSHNQEILYNLTERTLVVDEGKIAIDSDTFSSIEFYNKKISSKSQFSPSLHNSFSSLFYFSNTKGVETDKYFEGEDIIVNYSLNEFDRENTNYIKYTIRNKQRILVYEKTIEYNIKEHDSKKIKILIKGIIARNIYSVEIFKIKDKMDSYNDQLSCEKEIKYFEVMGTLENSEFRGICDMRISVID